MSDAMFNSNSSIKIMYSISEIIENFYFESVGSSEYIIPPEILFTMRQLQLPLKTQQKH